MTPRQRYRELVAQGYSPEAASKRSGYFPRGSAPPAPLAPMPPERKAERQIHVELEALAPEVTAAVEAATRYVPNEAQVAWKQSGMPRPPVIPAEASQTWASGGATPGPKRKARPRATEFVRIELPPAVPPPPAPRPLPTPKVRTDPPGFIQPVGDTDWREQALCAQADPEAWFVDKGGSTKPAKRVCARCPVRPECLTDALANDERFGVRGGLSERERRRLKAGQEGAA